MTGEYSAAGVISEYVRHHKSFLFNKRQECNPLRRSQLDLDQSTLQIHCRLLPGIIWMNNVYWIFECNAGDMLELGIVMFFYLNIILVALDQNVYHRSLWAQHSSYKTILVFENIPFLGSETTYASFKNSNHMKELKT